MIEGFKKQHNHHKHKREERKRRKQSRKQKWKNRNKLREHRRSIKHTKFSTHGNKNVSDKKKKQIINRQPAVTPTPPTPSPAPAVTPTPPPTPSPAAIPTPPPAASPTPSPAAIPTPPPAASSTIPENSNLNFLCSPASQYINSFVWGLSSETLIGNENIDKQQIINNINNHFGNGTVYNSYNYFNMMNSLDVNLNNLMSLICDSGYQGSCGCCWLFATSQVLSDMFLIQYYKTQLTNNVQNFSIGNYSIDPLGLFNENLYSTDVSCGCNGGNISSLVNAMATQTFSPLYPSNNDVSFIKSYNAANQGGNLESTLDQFCQSVDNFKSICNTTPDLCGYTGFGKYLDGESGNILSMNYYGFDIKNFNSPDYGQNFFLELGETYNLFTSHILCNGPLASTISIIEPTNPSPFYLNFTNIEPVANNDSPFLNVFENLPTIKAENPLNIFFETGLDNIIDYTKPLMSQYQTASSLPNGEGHAVSVVGFILAPINEDYIKQNLPDKYDTWKENCQYFFQNANIYYDGKLIKSFEDTQVINSVSGNSILLPCFVYRNSWGEGEYTLENDSYNYDTWGNVNLFGLKGHWISPIPPFSFRIQPIVSFNPNTDFYPILNEYNNCNLNKDYCQGQTSSFCENCAKISTVDYPDYITNQNTYQNFINNFNTGVGTSYYIKIKEGFNEPSLILNQSLSNTNNKSVCTTPNGWKTLTITNNNSSIEPFQKTGTTDSKGSTKSSKSLSTSNIILIVFLGVLLIVCVVLVCISLSRKKKMKINM
jgi:hypothetical protein